MIESVISYFINIQLWSKDTVKVDNRSVLLLLQNGTEHVYLMADISCMVDIFFISTPRT
jgi:hypothetical protein